jgi:hypothetical protein
LIEVLLTSWHMRSGQCWLQPDEIGSFDGTAKVRLVYRVADSFDTKEARFGLK